MSSGVHGAIDNHYEASRNSVFGVNKRAPSMFSRVKQSLATVKDETNDGRFSRSIGGTRNSYVYGQNVRASLATQSQTAAIVGGESKEGAHQRLSSFGSKLGGANQNGSTSVMSFDSFNIKKTAQLGVRSSGFFELGGKDKQAATVGHSQPNMAFQRVAGQFNRVDINAL